MVTTGVTGIVHVRKAPEHTYYNITRTNNEDEYVAYSVRSFKASVHNHPPCPKCEATDHGDTVHRTYIRQPCRCCGTQDHSMINTTLNDDGKHVTEFTCPIIDSSADVSLSEQLSHNYIRYRADEHKFAEYHGYNPESITEALEIFGQQGEGSHMTPKCLNSFKNRVLRICEDERASWTFKRSSMEDESQEEFEL
jgi:hypothetical protein